MAGSQIQLSMYCSHGSLPNIPPIEKAHAPTNAAKWLRWNSRNTAMRPNTWLGNWAMWARPHSHCAICGP